MLLSGLVSITFRDLPPEEIVNLVSKAGLDGIEWGGDVHVPHGDTSKAQYAHTLTTEAGLNIASYGSYYRCAESEKEGLAFNAVLDTTLALGASTLRVWAGRQASDQADEDYRKRVAEDSHRIANIAENAGVHVAFEFHGKTLTDTYESAQRLLFAEARHNNMLTYWQPPLPLSVEERIKGLRLLTGKLSNIHVFHWERKQDTFSRRPLQAGINEWRRYLDAIPKDDSTRYAMLEFVKDGCPNQFLRDAATLKRLLSSM